MHFYYHPHLIFRQMSTTICGCSSPPPIFLKTNKQTNKAIEQSGGNYTGYYDTFLQCTKPQLPPSAASQGFVGAPFLKYGLLLDSLTRAFTIRSAQAGIC